jgi:hypothetical protein
MLDTSPLAHARRVTGWYITNNRVSLVLTADVHEVSTR